MLTYRRALYLLLVFNLFFLVGNCLFSLPAGLALVSVSLFLLFCLYGSVFVCSNFYVPVQCRLPQQEKKIILSFDDGPHPVETEKVLQVLRTHDIRASFFMIGQEVEKMPLLVNKMLGMGHVLGNHSYRHRPLFPLQTPKQIAHELKRTQELLQTLQGEAIPFFRPPFGVTNPMIASALNRMNPRPFVVGWSLRSFDTLLIHYPDLLLKRLIRNTHPGAVVLMHDRLPGIHKVLELYIQYLKENGYSFATMQELNPQA